MGDTKKTTKKSEYSFQDLIALEKMARIICTKYENTTKRYDGTVDNKSSSYNLFMKYNNIRNKIIEKMEQELSNIL